MPTKRTIISRRRRPLLSPEAVTLFAVLERVPLRHRHRQDFRDRERELMRALGLTAEFWTANSVLDRSPGPCHPEEYVAHGDWHTCRKVRERLLEAAKPSRSP